MIRTAIRAHSPRSCTVGARLVSVRILGRRQALWLDHRRSLWLSIVHSKLPALCQPSDFSSSNVLALQGFLFLYHIGESSAGQLLLFESDRPGIQCRLRHRHDDRVCADRFVVRDLATLKSSKRHRVHRCKLGSLCSKQCYYRIAKEHAATETGTATSSSSIFSYD